MIRAVRLVAAVLVLVPFAAPGASIEVRGEVVAPGGEIRRLDEPLLPPRAIVELAPPRAAASGQRSARAALLAQFRSDLQRLAAIAPAKIDHEYSTVFFGAAIDAPPASLAALRALEYVVAIHADRPVRAYATGEVIDARPRVNAAGLGARGAGTVVSIIDTGIDYTHPALGGGFGPAFKVIGGYDFVNADEDPMDDHGHGTHVAGTVAANAEDLVGVAPDAKLLGYKVLDPRGFGSSSDIIAAIERSVDPNGDGDRSDAAHVINLSLGGGGTADDPMARAVDAAVEAGVVVCVAAGNSGETASIGSPGAAARAITVGAVDGAGVLAQFSSRGPSSKLLTFKPEITAPGVGIVSARAGGGVVAANGTSMAAPHVAGVAALLREMHPEWQPARVKGAIVGGAVPMLGTPFARGAGRVDAVRAANAAVLASEAGISFGLSHESSGTTRRSHSIAVTNTGSRAETFAATPPANRTGLVVSVSPSRIELAPGESATIAVEIAIDNALAPFPDQPMLGGDIQFTSVSGISGFSIPWALLRGARATVTYDAFATSLLVFAPDASRQPVAYAPGAWETFVKPGATWEILLTGIDLDEDGANPTALRYLVAEKQAIEGDATFAFTAAGASVGLSFAAQDSEGRLLRELPEEEDSQRRYAMARLHFGDGDWQFSSSVQMRGLRDIFTTPVSDRYTLIPSESYIDLVAMRGYQVQHPVFRGASESATLTAGPADYLHAKLRWERPALPRELFIACNAGAVTRGSLFAFSTGGCAGRDIGGPVAFDYFTTPETTDETFSGLAFQTGSFSTPAFRGRDGAIVASSERIPPRTTPSIPDGGEAAIGGGLFFPFAFYGTTAGQPVLWPSASFVGPFGETLRYDTVPARWESFDASGTRISSGTMDPFRGIVPYGSPNGSRLVVRREWRHQSGLTTGGTLEVGFAAAGTDLTAPTITSLRVADAAGRTASRLATGDAASLHFSAADLDHAKRMEPKPTRTEATRVFYRVAGSGSWVPLAIALVDSETGSTTTQGHVPAGDIYRADLSDAARLAGLVDLRIELEDLAGNRIIWTQEGALIVGPEGVPAPRARKVVRP